MHLYYALRSNLKRELGFTLRLSPDDKRDNDAHAEQDTESDNIPHGSSAQDSQQTEAKTEYNFFFFLINTIIAYQ